MSNRVQQKLRDFLTQHPDIEIFEVILPDLNGGQRGKWVTRDKIEKCFRGGVKLPYSTLAFDIWGRDPGELVFEAGDGDGICHPDVESLTVVPWLDRPTGQVLVSLKQPDGSDGGYDSRLLLQGLMERLASHGLRAVVASEMEFYLLGMDSDSLRRPQHTQATLGIDALSTGQTYSIDLMQDMAGLMHSIKDACQKQGLPVDTLIKEGAQSQYEINLFHQQDALRAADQALMLQRVIRGVAKRQDFRASFMAKPFGDLPGNGMHIHCSLIDEHDNNAFNNGTDAGNDLLRHAIAGCLDMMADSMLLFAPHINSYRRFQAGSHAPLAPSWGYENRTVSIRVPTDAHEAMRLEHRVGGADASPYLAISAILAGMLHGIENKLEAPAPIVGSAYDQCPPSLPRYWPQAIDAFEQSDTIREYFGETFQRVYTLVKRQEIAEFDRLVTPLEYDSYL